MSALSEDISIADAAGPGDDTQNPPQADGEQEAQDAEQNADAEAEDPTGQNSFAQAAARRTSKFAARTKVLNLEQRKELEETFQLFDTDGSGTMEPAELRVVLWALGFDVDAAEIELMVSKFLGIEPDEAEDVSLTLDQFMVLMIEKMVWVHLRLALDEYVADRLSDEQNERDSPEKLMKAFQLFDSEKRGKFGAKDLRRVARDLNEPLGEEEMQLIIDELDKDGDGEIGIDDWMRAMSKTR
ncbi:hypothetical protein HK105_203611 [Polyrhizophydium stewartii]|uniref:EF-hand domain-containing protein n=1 Tax=Polyrhizophydium stewartii TaxID=2732419 RepID=A0ABR4NBG9_9FUNG